MRKRDAVKLANRDEVEVRAVAREDARLRQLAGRTEDRHPMRQRKLGQAPRKPERGSARIRRRQVADARQRAGALRARGQCRRDQCEAGVTEHVPASWDHWITSSARASIAGGTTTPRARAVAMLTTSSYFVSSSIGRSPGRVPLRILSTYVAERRADSARSGP